MDRRTPSQQQAITGTQAEICVSAGAGSGKTLVLVDRFVHLVLERQVPIDAILAITFTEKAAAEMKERIARAFEAAGRDDERRQMESAYLSTIDALCARLLRENALEAGVDPRFRVLEEFEAARLLRAAADTVLLGWPEEDLRGLLEATRVSDLAAALRRLYEQIRHAGMPCTLATLEPSLPAASAEADLAAALDALRGAGRMESLTPRQEEILGTVAHLASEAASIEAARPVDLARAFQALRQRFDFKGMHKRPRFAAALRRVDEALAALLAERLEVHARPARILFASLLALLDEEYGRAKRAQSALDFSDLELAARDLLARSPSLGPRLRRRFRHIFLDELQDTNPLQREILELLRGDNSFFAAGDAKQAIYGFRDADVSGILGQQDRAERTGAHIRLRENFRSRPELVEFTNRLFATALWRPGSVAFSAMKPAALHRDKAEASVEVLLAEGDDAEEGRGREAEALADRIAALIEERRLSVTRREAEGEGRPLGYGDVAILFRSTGAMRLYERALALRRIPYFVQKGRGYFQTQEVRDLLNFLRILDNPRDDFHLASVLRSPLCGLRDDDLLCLARRDFSGQRLADRLSAETGLSEEGRGRLARFLRLYEDIRDRKGKGPLWRELERVLSESPLALDALFHFNGRRRFANQKKLVALVRGWESAAASSLRELMALLADYTAAETREAEAMVESSTDDTVKLMTIHAAKGLEFPLVALADLGHADPPRSGGELFARGAGMSLAFHDPASRTRGLKPVSYRNLEASARAAALQEENRLLYVALTRAREHLILSGWKARGRRGESWMGAILAGMEEGGLGPPLVARLPADEACAGTGRMEALATLESDRLARGEALAHDAAPAETEGLAAEIFQRALLSSPRSETTPYVTTATEIVQYHLCPRRYHLRYLIGAPGIEHSGGGAEASEEPETFAREMPAPGGDDGERGRLADDELPAEALGDRVHRVLAEPEGSDRAGGWLASLPPREQAEALRQVERFRRSELGRQARRVQALREVPFALARCGATLRGQIDLVLDPGGAAMTLVDYKTSRIAAGEVAQKAAAYELQLRLYALAAREIFGVPARRACLHFLHPDVIHEVDLSGTSLAAAERAIAAFFEAHRSAAYPQRPAFHCYACAYRKHYCPGLVVPA